MKKSILFSRKSNRKITKILFAALLAGSVLFASCSDSDDSNQHDKSFEEREAEEKARVEREKEAAAKAALPDLYEKVIGSWEPENPHAFSGTWRAITFNPDSVVLDGETLRIRVPDDLMTAGAFAKIAPYSYYPEDSFVVKTESCYIPVEIEEGCIGIYHYTTAPAEISYASYLKSSTSGSGGSGSSGSEGGENISVTGTYAGSDRYNSSITMNDNGTWTFGTSKPGSAVSGGTYTVSGNKITMKYTARGTDFEETFTVTNSGSQSTWKTSQNGASTLFSTLFMEVGTEYTFIKS